MDQQKSQAFQMDQQKNHAFQKKDLDFFPSVNRAIFETAYIAKGKKMILAFL